MEATPYIDWKYIFKEIADTMEYISNDQKRLYADLKENKLNSVLGISETYLTFVGELVYKHNKLLEYCPNNTNNTSFFNRLKQYKLDIKDISDRAKYICSRLCVYTDNVIEYRNYSIKSKNDILNLLENCSRVVFRLSVITSQIKNRKSLCGKF